MATAELIDITQQDVIHWRIEQLEGAGYETEDALVLAFRTDVDLHRAVDLAHRGCPSGMAVRILL